MYKFNKPIESRSQTEKLNGGSCFDMTCFNFIIKCPSEIEAVKNTEEFTGMIIFHLTPKKTAVASGIHYYS